MIEMAIGILGLGVAGAFWFLQETRIPVSRPWLGAIGLVSGVLIVFALLMCMYSLIPARWGTRSLSDFMTIGALVGTVVGATFGGLAWKLTATRNEEAPSRAAVAPLTPSREEGTADRATRIRVRTKELIPKLVALISRGEAIERDLIGDLSQRQNFPKYQKRVEDWRSEIGEFCKRELPDSGAGIIALPREGVLIGNPIAFEISRLRNAITAQRDILKNLESYVGRTLADSFPGAPADDPKGNALHSLIALHKSGINDLLSGPSARKSLAEFNDDVESWKRMVVIRLRPVAKPTEIARFQDLGVFNGANLDGITPQHGHMRDIVWEHLQRLWAVIERVEAAGEYVTVAQRLPR